MISIFQLQLSFSTKLLNKTLPSLPFLIDQSHQKYIFFSCPLLSLYSLSQMVMVSITHRTRVQVVQFWEFSSQSFNNISPLHTFFLKKLFDHFVNFLWPFLLLSVNSVESSLTILGVFYAQLKCNFIPTLTFCLHLDQKIILFLGPGFLWRSYMMFFYQSFKQIKENIFILNLFLILDYLSL